MNTSVDPPAAVRVGVGGWTEPPAAVATPARDVFVVFISGAKEKAPAATMALLRHLN